MRACRGDMGSFILSWYFGFFWVLREVWLLLGCDMMICDWDMLQLCGWCRIVLGWVCRS